jgi:hypothetical protein
MIMFHFGIPLILAFELSVILCTESDISRAFCNSRDDIFKLSKDSKESIPPANVAWRAGTTTLFLFGS